MGACSFHARRTIAGMKKGALRKKKEDPNAVSTL